MRHDPRSELIDLVVESLQVEGGPTGAEAKRVAGRVGGYLTVAAVSGSVHFELLDVTLRLNDLCGAAVRGELTRYRDGFAGLPLIGVLIWIRRMGAAFYLIEGSRLPNRVSSVGSPRAPIDRVEAATCLAPWRQEAEARPHTPTTPWRGCSGGSTRFSPGPGPAPSAGSGSARPSPRSRPSVA